MSHLHNRLKLFRYPAFRWYLVSSMLSCLGSGLSYIAINWMVLAQRDSVGSVAIVMLCFWAPGIVLGPFMGVIVDRISRRNHLLSASNWTRALVLIGVGYYLINHHSLIAIYVLGLLLGMFFSVYIPAALRLTREMIPKEELLYANASVDMMFEIGNIVGMGLAGFLIHWISGPGVLILNGAIFCLSGLSMLMIRSKHLTITIAENTKLNIIGDFKAGLTYIRSSKVLLVVYSLQLLFFVEYLTAPVLIAPYAKNILHANVTQFGYIEAALSIGVVLGGIFMAWLTEIFGFIKTLLVGSILLGSCYIFFSHNNSIFAAEIIYFIIGFGFAMWPVIVTRAQHLTDIEYQGRVQSCFNSISGLIMVSVFLLVKFTSQYVPVQAFYWLEVFFTFLAIVLLIIYRKKSDD